MFSPSNPGPSDRQDWTVLPLDTVTLSNADIENAVQVSQAISKPDRQWQIYRHALALSGFKQWLRSRSPRFPLHAETCSLYQPAIASLVESVCQLSVNNMKVCLLALGCLDDPILSIPRAVLDLSDYAAQIYILVDVLEEHQQVQVVGYGTHSQLMSQIIERNPTSWTYDIAKATFTTDVDSLLLILERLDPNSVPLPQAVGVETNAIAILSQRLNQLWPRLRDPEFPLEDVLSWQEAAIILQCVEQQNWLYQLQMGREPLPLRPVFEDKYQSSAQNIESIAAQPLAPSIVNAGQWLQNQLGQIAQDLEWVLMPSLSLGFRGLRSASLVDNFETVVASLNADGIAISPHAQGAYKDIVQNELTLRLYAIIWPLDKNEWVLLLILGTTPGTPAPMGMRLTVYDQSQCLADRQLSATSSDGYLYAQVVGDRQECFWVVIDNGSGHPIALAPFSFDD